MYENRVLELKEFKNILNIIKTKIKFTYEPLAEIFKQISKDGKTEIEKIFGKMASQLEYIQVREVWENCIQEADISIKQTDKNVIKRLGNLLGQTDVEGQVSEIEVTQNFLDMQIEEAEEEKKKNQKMYKTLGIVFGLVFVIILMSIDLLFKIAAIGILVAVLHQVLVRAGREDQAMMTTLAGLVIVLSMVIQEISSLFDSVRTLFNL